MGLDKFNKFFTDTQDDPHNRQWIFMLIFQAALYGTTIIRALVLFNPSTFVGRAVPVLAYVLVVAWLARLYGAMAYQTAVDGEYSEENLGILNLTIVVFAVFPPVLMTLTLGLSSFASPCVQRVPPSPITRTAPTSSAHSILSLASLALSFALASLAHRCGTLCKAFGFFFAINFAETLVGVVYSWYLIPIFFDSATTEWTRIVIRTVGASCFAILNIEASWRSSRFLITIGVPEQNTHLMFAVLAGVLPLFSRVMQGSAQSVVQSVIFELTGTLAELFTADTLLRGSTPLNEGVEGVLIVRQQSRRLSGRLSFRESAPDKVAPAPAAPVQVADNDGGGEGGEEDPTEAAKRAYKRHRLAFCSTALILVSLAECSSIFVSSAFWLFSRANPGSPGSRPIPVSQTLLNIGIMILGELFLTDGIIAYIGRHSKRYSNDPAGDWAEFRRNKVLLWSVIACIACIAIPVMMNLPSNMCMTAFVGEEEHWAMTSCPPVPQNITEMAHVGPKWREQWEKYQ
jgi:hypothetical protein